MGTKEKTNREFKCCMPGMDRGKMSEMMAECCGGASTAGDCRSMMSECMKRCRFFPLIPVIIGVVLLLLGYYLDASIVRILWMAACGVLILMGIVGFLMMNVMSRK